MKKILKFLLSAILIIVGVVIFLGINSQGPVKTCEDLSPSIIELSKENKGPFSAKILKLYNIKENDANPSGKILDCTATAKTNRSEDVVINFFLEEDSDGDRFIGYKMQ